jgi:hypothetical protein
MAAQMTRFTNAGIFAANCLPYYLNLLQRNEPRVRHGFHIAFVSLKVPKYQSVDMTYPHVADDRRVRNYPKSVRRVIQKFLESCEGPSGTARGKGGKLSARVACDRYHGEQAGCEVQRAAGAISRHHVRTCGYDVTAEQKRDRYLPVQNTLRANFTLVIHSTLLFFV